MKIEMLGPFNHENETPRHDDDPLGFWRGLGWAMLITAGMVLLVAAVLQIWF